MAGLGSSCKRKRSEKASVGGRIITILRETNHTNIVRLLDVSKHPETGQLCLIMEYCVGGDFDKYLVGRGGKISEREGYHFFHQLASGFGYLCGKGIMHRDLKPENLLLTHEDNNSSFLDLKIADFGLARLLDDPQQMARTQCGTRYYMAPEIYLGNKYTYKADLWSIGVIIYRSLLGKTLFTHLPTVELSDPNYSFLDVSELKSFSLELINLLKGLLQKDPQNRISDKEFLQHPFFKIHEDPSWESCLKDFFPARDPLKKLQNINRGGGEGGKIYLTTKKDVNNSVDKLRNLLQLIGIRNPMFIQTHQRSSISRWK
eukprot:TRINITY_DN4588_c0_g1_i8.p1 TRINITY_DN4588_c0_g1~~TRINITY_DN4588_c0_g1_i8.p1  ORF type:complete len:317 (+),score=50.89 TRINITY_DN4588_c0_g1_i8:250-1200(+)